MIFQYDTPESIKNLKIKSKVKAESLLNSVFFDFNYSRKKERNQQLKKVFAMVENFILSNCQYKKLNIPTFPNWKDPKVDIIVYLNKPNGGKPVVDRFVNEYINWNIYKDISRQDVKETFIEVIYKHKVDPFTLKLYAPEVPEYKDFWNKHSEKGQV